MGDVVVIKVVVCAVNCEIVTWGGSKTGLTSQPSDYVLTVCDVEFFL